MTVDQKTPALPVTSPTEGPDDNYALIQEMVAKAEDSARSDAMPETVVHKGDETLEAPMVAGKVTSAGYKYLYDTLTHERFDILYYMVAAKLKVRRKDGSLRFTADRPSQKPKRGTFKCLLHADNPMREHYDNLGIARCPVGVNGKDNISNQYQVTQHMRKKHPGEWATIEAERLEAERQEGLGAQRAQTAALEAIARGSITVEPAPAPSEPPVVTEETLFQCPECDIPPFTSEAGMKRHKTAKHKE